MGYLTVDMVDRLGDHIIRRILSNGPFAIEGFTHLLYKPSYCTAM